MTNNPRKCEVIEGYGRRDPRARAARVGADAREHRVPARRSRRSSGTCWALDERRGVRSSLSRRSTTGSASGTARTRRADPRIAAHIDAAIGGARTRRQRRRGHRQLRARRSRRRRGRTGARDAPAAAGRRVAGRARGRGIASVRGGRVRRRARRAHGPPLARSRRRPRRVAARCRASGHLPVRHLDDRRLWLINDYFPEILELDSERAAPSPAMVARASRRAEDRSRARPGRLHRRLRWLLLEPARGVSRSDGAGRHVVVRQLDDAVEARGVERLRAALRHGGVGRPVRLPRARCPSTTSATGWSSRAGSEGPDE